MPRMCIGPQTQIMYYHSLSLPARLLAATAFLSFRSSKITHVQTPYDSTFTLPQPIYGSTKGLCVSVPPTPTIAHPHRRTVWPTSSGHHPHPTIHTCRQSTPLLEPAAASPPLRSAMGYAMRGAFQSAHIRCVTIDVLQVCWGPERPVHVASASQVHPKRIPSPVQLRTCMDCASGQSCYQPAPTPCHQDTCRLSIQFRRATPINEQPLERKQENPSQPCGILWALAAIDPSGSSQTSRAATSVPEWLASARRLALGP